MTTQTNEKRITLVVDAQQTQLAVNPVDSFRGEKGEKGDPGVLTGIAENCELLDGKPSGYYSRLRSLLDNGNFQRPVNQRGQNSYTSANSYTIDRWVMSRGRVRVLAAGVSLEGTDGSCVLSQYIPDLADGDYCFAAKAGGKIVCRNFRLEGNAVTAMSSGNAYPGGYLQTLYSSERDAVQLALRAESGYTVTLEWAALYPGTFAPEDVPLFVPRDYADELLACQRYLVVYPSAGGYVVPFACGTTYTTTSARFELDLPVPMALDQPSITLVGLSANVRILGAVHDFSSLSVTRCRGNKLYLQAAVENVTGSNPCVLTISGTGGMIIVSAEI